MKANNLTVRVTWILSGTVRQWSDLSQAQANDLVSHVSRIVNDAILFLPVRVEVVEGQP